LPARSSITFFRLQIAVDDALTVRLVERGADLPRDLRPFPPRDRPQPLEDRAQALALDVLHREVRRRAGAGELVGAADVLVGDAAGETDFVEESLGLRAVGGDLGLQDLQRDDLARLAVLRLVDHAHPAAPGLLEQFVAGGEVGGPGRWGRHLGRIIRSALSIGDWGRGYR